MLLNKEFYLFSTDFKKVILEFGHRYAYVVFSFDRSRHVGAPAILQRSASRHSQ